MQYRSITTGNRVMRLLWGAAWLLLYRPSPVPLHGWRRFVLRLFGAEVASGAHPYPRARIWAPWSLTMGKDSCLANDVDCYNVARVTLGEKATVSQYSYLCTASHDYRASSLPLVAAPIEIRDFAWVAADCFVGPGVTVDEGCVVGARSTVTKSTMKWTVVAGSPPRVLKERDREGFLQ
jgi:putative colanic acid biosynthesis acetyltransferase WcaF